MAPIRATSFIGQPNDAHADAVPRSLPQPQTLLPRGKRRELHVPANIVPGHAGTVFIRVRSARQGETKGGIEREQEMKKRAVAVLIAVSLAAVTGHHSPANAQSAWASVVTGLNMRQGPSTQYGVITTIPGGSTVPVHRCTSGYSWCEVSHAGRNGWVSARYLRDTRQAFNNRPIAEVGPQLGIALFDFIIGQIANAGPGGLGAGPHPGQACFYEHVNFSGASFCARTGQSAANIGAQWNDRISSIRVGPGVTVQACEHANFAGSCDRFARNVNRLAANDTISSYSVGGPFQVGDGRPGRVCFFEHRDFAGNRFCANEDQYAAFVGQAWNDRISSIQVEQGATLQACQHANLEGWCERYDGSVRRLAADRNDEISSYAIR